jgi:hypothetical protein
MPEPGGSGSQTLAKSQCCGTGSVGTVTFCLSGIGTVIKITKDEMTSFLATMLLLLA